MTTARCQICGRENPLTTDGLLFKHYVAGEVCYGSGNLPFHASCSALEAAVAHYADLDGRCTSIYGNHLDQRINEPLSKAFWQQWSYVASRRATLERRLRKWQRTYGARMAA